MKKTSRIGLAVMLIFYLFTFRELSELCYYGGVRKHIPPLAFGMIGLLLGFLLWLFSWVRSRKEEQHYRDLPEIRRYILWAELLIFIVGTLWFGGRIVYFAMPYHGALSWKVDAWRHEKKVVLEHNNFLESGVEGILTDLDKELDLPEELYLINKYQMTFDGDGTIQTIYTFLYGKDTEGKTKTYLIDYNAAKGNRMTVRTDGAAVTDYNPDMRLEPMLMILEKADYRQRLSDWENIFGDKIYGILYFGRRSFRSEEGLCYIPGDADQDGAESGTSDFTPLQRGGEVTGFALSLHIPSAEEVTPVRYMMEPEYKSQEELDREEAVRENEREAGQIEAFREMDGFQVDRTTGAMYFFLNESLGWRFIVTDAALGSRFYGMEQTGDGGTTWQIINKDPFNGDMGVTEGLVFLDENFGFAGLSGASETSSLMFVTRDGGKTFAKVLLPMDTVTELPESAGEYGFTIEDYDYIHMPEKDGDAFVICVSSEALEREGILFRSSDAGETWEYAGCRQYSDSSTS